MKLRECLLQASKMGKTHLQIGDMEKKILKHVENEYVKTDRLHYTLRRIGPAQEYAIVCDTEPRRFWIVS